jgi:hypothetical protein
MSNLLVTKDNLGVVLLLLLVVFLSQSKLLSFFSESKLGRGFILIFIIFITFCNKSLGIISVLLVIIVFTYLSSGNLIKQEGFDNSTSSDISPKKLSSDNKIVAKEGFDIYTLEDSIKRGKLSNELPSYNNGKKVDIDNLSSFNEVYTSMYSSI